MNKIKNKRRLQRYICVKLARFGKHLNSAARHRDPIFIETYFVFLILFIIALAIYYFYKETEPFRRWLSTPNGKATYVDWVGNKSIFDLLSGMSATIAAIAAVFLALRSYRINQRVALANRYQKGVELLGANVDSSKIGGIELLSMVSREAYKEFQEPVIRTLRQFLQERCSPIVDEVHNTEEPKKPERPSDLVINATISAIVRTNRRKRWLDSESDEHGLNLPGIYLHQTQLTGYDFSRINIKYSLLGFVVFKDCNFTHTNIDARCFGNLVFDHCTFESTKIHISDLKGVKLRHFGDFITFKKCKNTYNIRINR